MKLNQNIIFKNWLILIAIVLLSVAPFMMNNYWIGLTSEFMLFWVLV